MCRTDLKVMQNIIIDTYNATFISMCIDQKTLIAKALQLTGFAGYYQINSRYRRLNLRSKVSCHSAPAAGHLHATACLAMHSFRVSKWPGSTPGMRLLMVLTVTQTLAVQPLRARHYAAAATAAAAAAAALSQMGVRPAAARQSWTGAFMQSCAEPGSSKVQCPESVFMKGQQ